MQSLHATALVSCLGRKQRARARRKFSRCLHTRARRTARNQRARLVAASHPHPHPPHTAASRHPTSLIVSPIRCSCSFTLLRSTLFPVQLPTTVDGASQDSFNLSLAQQQLSLRARKSSRHDTDAHSAYLLLAQSSLVVAHSGAATLLP